MVLTDTPSPIATIGQTYYFTPKMKYANPCASCFHVSGLPGWMRFNPKDGGIWGTPTAAGTWSNITISAWNGVDGATLPPFKITVKSAPLLRIAGSPAATAAVSQYYYFKPTVTAAANSKLTYKISNRPAWAAFNASTGALYGTPAAANVATFANVLISVTNGSTTAGLPAFKIAVTRPVIGHAALSWTKPTRNTDGTPLTNLAGFHVHYGLSVTALNQVVTVASPNAGGASIENLTGGKWYFAMSSYTNAGVEGVTSTPVSKTIQ